MSLSPAETARYQRHLILPGFGLEAQEKLKSSSVLVIGAGGLGCPALLYLAAAGIGKMGIVDNDTVSESNLHRQVLFNLKDIGMSKAQLAAQKVLETNPFTEVQVFDEMLQIQNALSILKDFDIIVDGSDNFTTRYLVNDACVILNKPLVSGSIFKFEGQVSVFNFQNGPTYRCLFPEPPSADEMPNCSEIGVLGVLPGVVGTVMATEALKLATGIGEVLSGRLLVYDALSMTFNTLSFEGVPENKQITHLTETRLDCSVQEMVEISADELKKWQLSGKKFQLIDVRESYEHEAFNIKGENMPLSELENWVHKISREQDVVVHCQAGLRSKKAIQKLRNQSGFTNLVNLKNGLQDW